MNNLETPRFDNPQAEIAHLKEQIKSKETELAEKKIDFHKDTVIADQISRYRDEPTANVLKESYVIPQKDVEAIVLDLAPERHDDKMSEFLGLLKEKGIKNTMSVLSAMKDPHLEDDFHRFLVQYIKHGHEAKGVSVTDSSWRGLCMTLYEVVLPEDKDPNNLQGHSKTLKELISGMEQFLAGMLSVTSKDSTKHYKENYIVLEIANANGSDQFIFYVAVPNQHKELFERQISSVFHNVRLTIANSDYNIFNNEGVSLGSYLQSSVNPVYQFKTYEVFDHDPMNVVLNSFSKIEKEGEGASIQIIFAPKDDYFNKKYQYAIDSIEKGTPTKDAINLPETIGGSVVKTVKSIFKSAPKPDAERKPVDSEAIQKIKLKISSTIVATNIRIIASAKTEVDASRIIQGIESSFNQFTDASATGLKAKRLTGNSLRQMFRSYSFRNYEPSELLPLNLKEITTLIHFQTNTLSPTPQLKQSQAIQAPAPAEMLFEGTLLGVNSYRNTDTTIYIQDEDRLRHLYTIGQTGTGKTTLLKNMIIQDILRGDGVCFIDPHGTDVLDILANVPKERFQDVIYFDPSFTERPMALNMLEYDRNHPEQKTFVVNELFSIFQK